MSRFVWRKLLGCTLAAGCMIGMGAPSSRAAVAVSLPNFTRIVKNNAAAVVHVEARYGARRVNATSALDSGRALIHPSIHDPQWIFRHFFGLPEMPSPQQRAHFSLGSGFIISSDGYILTNNHVVAGADSVTVRLQNRRILTARVVGADAAYDIALLKVHAGRPLPTVRIGDSHLLKPGQWVLAIGSPFGFDYTVTHGIISAVGRSLLGSKQKDVNFIQTDVPINRGNSGGPLFNLKGKVVGVNSQIYSNTGGYMGVSFSIPINIAMHVVQQLKTKGYVTHGRLGVVVQQVDASMVKALKLRTESGAIVVKVVPGSAADKAGIQVGDIIIGYNGQVIDKSAELPPLVAITAQGTKVPIAIWRRGRVVTLSAVITTLTAPP